MWELFVDGVCPDSIVVEEDLREFADAEAYYRRLDYRRYCNTNIYQVFAMYDGTGSVEVYHDEFWDEYYVFILAAPKEKGGE